MGININSIETLAEWVSKYTKTCGVKSILQTQTPALKGVNIADIFQLGKNKFTQLELELMKRLRSLKLEDARVINKNGILLDDIKFINDKYSVKFDPSIPKELLLKRIENSTFIHNHTYKTSLSSKDFYFMANISLKKIIATTPDGGYSVLKKIGSWNRDQRIDFRSACCDLINKEYTKQLELKSIRGITNPERLNRFNEWKSKEFGKLANEFGLKFENKIERVTELDYTPNELFKINPIQNFIDKALILKNRIFKTQ